jgi:hypothetical protein
MANLLQWSAGDGENLASGYQSWAEVVGAWYNEQSEYSYANPGFSEATGHFTQVCRACSCCLSQG